jgi:hypothetical protein
MHVFCEIKFLENAQMLKTNILYIFLMTGQEHKKTILRVFSQRFYGIWRQVNFISLFINGNAAC